LSGKGREIFIFVIEYHVMSKSITITAEQYLQLNAQLTRLRELVDDVELQFKSFKSEHGANTKAPNAPAKETLKEKVAKYDRLIDERQAKRLAKNSKNK